ncbi:hypothetical protein O53_4575 [Microcystis aeruginosa TAIHU98]|uniref:Uncharacterized protein n=1 Tax=Microcystis aeruginosa TAIHU98 TaxID=1134457 RepID=L7E3G8_MICAE|nr:hypothetical protein O53_4575 [Microcystis aeruginosa TAIHU98]
MLDAPLIKGGIKGGSAPRLSRGTGEIKGKIYRLFNYNHLLN